MRAIEAFLDACCDTERLAPLVAPDFSFEAPGVTLDRAGFLELVRRMEEAGVAWVLEDLDDSPGSTEHTGAVRIGTGRPVRATWIIQSGDLHGFRLEHVPGPLRELLKPQRTARARGDSPRPRHREGGTRRFEAPEWRMAAPVGRDEEASSRNQD